jgi:hypothetical protein
VQNTPVAAFPNLEEDTELYQLDLAYSVAAVWGKAQT